MAAHYNKEQDQPSSSFSMQDRESISALPQNHSSNQKRYVLYPPPKEEWL
ncbi:13012_t:CDS:2 [Entrophospora sp. SA101]|nr:13012_t:CDS:2 [Entrophospora sp. SA101]